MSYNIIRKDITNGLKGRQISSLGAGNYLILRYAPDLANVKVRLGSNTAPEIDMIQNDSIESSLVGAVYVECNAVPGEHIIFAQANKSKDFKIIPSPAIKSLSINGLFNPRLDNTITIAPGANYLLNTTTLKGIRFYASDIVGVALNASTNKYPMLEDEIFLTNISSVTFYNDTANTITLNTWEE